MPANEPTSQDRSAATRPPPRRDYIQAVVELVRQTAEAAHALHEQGIIHRDIKPGNIMVTADGQRAVLMDLGLAQLADEDEGRLTRTRQFVGTLRYASPQQVLAAGELDRRSDVYSLGATLWELLALKPLYGATEATPTPQLMQKILLEEPDCLSRSVPHLPKDLEAVVHRALEKKPDDRYFTAAELEQDLARCLRGEPVARPPCGRIRAPAPLVPPQSGDHEPGRRDSAGALCWESRLRPILPSRLAARRWQRYVRRKSRSGMLPRQSSKLSGLRRRPSGLRTRRSGPKQKRKTPIAICMSLT